MSVGYVPAGFNRGKPGMDPGVKRFHCNCPVDLQRQTGFAFRIVSSMQYA